MSKIRAIKTGTLLLTLLLFGLSEMGFAQYWIQIAGGLTIDEAQDIALDNNGNSYTVGYFTDNATFGTSNYTSLGSTDIFIFKTDNEGVIVWSAVAGGSGSDKGLSIAVDNNGNSYITGFFNGTASFGSTTLVSSGLQDVFVAKYNSSGVLQWAKKMGGSQADIGNGIAVDYSGNAIVTGEFKGTASFGTSSFTSTSNTVDAFVTKLSSSGNFTWTKIGTGTGNNRGADVTCDQNGNIITTGQFSSTITFDLAHPNTSSNVNFLIQFNSAGTEQWFRTIGGTSSSTVNALAADSIGNLYLTGDFTGNITFYGSPNVTLSATYSNKAFISKYSNSGQAIWAQSLSSESLMTSQSVAADALGNVYIAGHFRCQLSELRDAYGSGIFQVIGKYDIFVSQYDSNGNWQLARHLASRQDAFAYGIDVKSANQPHIAGSFQDTLNVPVSSNFITSNISNFISYEFATNNGFCGDASYGKFRRLASNGHSDILVANFVDPQREPYDFFDRSSSTNCDRSFIQACQYPGCPDTVSSCSGFENPIIFSQCPHICPLFSTNWFGATPDPLIPNKSNVTASGLITSISHAPDACITMYDTLYAYFYPGPLKPRISDNLGINTFSLNPAPIIVCSNQTVELTVDSITGVNFYWSSTSLSSFLFDTTIVVDTSGVYFVVATDSFGCQRVTSIQVTITEPLPPFILKSTLTDTLTFCGNEEVKFYLYDSISNPSAQEQCFNPILPYPVWTTITSITPSNLNYNHICGSAIIIYPDTSMWVSIEIQVVRVNGCGNDTLIFQDSFFVELLPYPEIPNLGLYITGNNSLCPGDSSILYAHNGPNYTWMGPGVAGDTNDSVIVYSGGIYGILTTLTDTNSFGCISYEVQTAGIIVNEKSSPILTASSFLICPNQSVILTILPGATQLYNDSVYFWEGPNGPINAHGPSIQVTEPGQYFCMVMDGDSCGLVSNTLTITLYITPGLTISGYPVLCDNDSIEIFVSTNEGSLVNWLAPLSGFGLSQTVDSAGIYRCNIFSCGIYTMAEIEIYESNVAANITIDGPLCDSQSVMLLGNDSMHTYTWFPTNDTTQNIEVFDEGQFVLITSDTAGCIAISDTVNVINYQVPTVIGFDGDSVICFGESLELMGNAFMNNYLWLPNGETSRSIIISNPGIYSLSTIDSLGCEGESTPVTISMPDTTIGSEALGSLRFCEGDSVILQTKKNGFETYVWLPDSALGKKIIVRESGTYQLMATDSFGCEAFSEKYIVYAEPNLISVPLGKDTTICAGDAILLVVSNNLGEIQWHDSASLDRLGFGQTYFTDSLFETTTYLVWSNYSLCKSDSNFITVYVKDCETPFVPNIFTPNGDGFNDIFRLKLDESRCFDGFIYNRWGQLVYQFDQINQGWDGTLMYSGEAVPEGTYYYILEYCDHYDKQSTLMGTVTLLRN